jgi:hypothetical protein
MTSGGIYAAEPCKCEERGAIYPALVMGLICRRSGVHIRPGILLLLLAVALIAASSCASQPPPESPRIDPVAWRSPHDLGVQHVGSVLVAEGALPLAYQAQEKGVLRAADETNGTQLAAMAVQAGQILAVTARGVEFGGRLLSGPLPADHRYMIYFDIERPEAGPPVEEKKE